MLVDAARLPVYLATSGGEMLERWPTILLLTTGVVAGTFLGAPMLRTLPELAFRRAVSVLLIGLGMALVAGLGA
jgi:uncharacterized membrane protein YfcA